MATLLARSDAWQTEVGHLRVLFNAWRSIRPERRPDEWIDGLDLHIAPDPGGFGLPDYGFAQHFGEALRRQGLPDTPATVRHMRACSAGLAEHPGALPTRGVLVTTLVFVRPWIDGSISYDANPEFSARGQSEFASEAVLGAMRKVILKHRNWLRARFGGHPMADIGEIRRAQPRSFAADPTRDAAGALELNYLQAALAESWSLEIISGANVNGLEGALTAYLDQVYERVRHRRVGAGLPVTPPAGWRGEARRALRIRFRPTPPPRKS